MRLENITSENELEIKDLIEKRVQAIRVNDIKTAVVNYADDVLLFDVVEALFEKGSSALKKIKRLVFYIRKSNWFCNSRTYY